MIVVAYHRNCTDGFVSAAIVADRLHRDGFDFVCVPCEYGRAMEMIAEKVTVPVTMYIAVDFSFSPEETLRTVNSNIPTPVVIIDHHMEVAAEYYTDIGHFLGERVALIFDHRHSGASLCDALGEYLHWIVTSMLDAENSNTLTWFKFKDSESGNLKDSIIAMGNSKGIDLDFDESLDRLVDGYLPDNLDDRITASARDYDLWIHAFADSKAFEAGMRYLYDYEHVDATTLLTVVQGPCPYESGKIILDYNKRQWSKLKRTNRTTLLIEEQEIVVDLYDCPAAWINELADGIYTKGVDCPDVVVGYRIGDGQRVSLSCRSRNELAATVAQYFKGNGHKNAAGAGTTLAKLFELITVTS